MLKDENGEGCIMSLVLSSLQPANFTSVAEYLDHSEYKPYLLDGGTDYARLEKSETLEQSSEALTTVLSSTAWAGSLNCPPCRI